MNVHWLGVRGRKMLKRFLVEARASQIGPDRPLTHWMMHSQSLGRRLCRQKFGSFGEGSWVQPGCYVRNTHKIHFGRDVILRTCSTLAPTDVDGGEIIVEDFALLGPDLYIVTGSHRFDNPDLPIYDQGAGKVGSVIIRKGAWLGARVIVLPGVEIGESAAIGAGSIVTNSIPPRCLAVGNPARVIRQLGNERLSVA